MLLFRLEPRERLVSYDIGSEIVVCSSQPAQSISTLYFRILVCTLYAYIYIFSFHDFSPCVGRMLLLLLLSLEVFASSLLYIQHTHTQIRTTPLVFVGAVFVAYRWNGAVKNYTIKIVHHYHNNWKMSLFSISTFLFSIGTTTYHMHFVAAPHTVCCHLSRFLQPSLSVPFVSLPLFFIIVVVVAVFYSL